MFITTPLFLRASVKHLHGNPRNPYFPTARQWMLLKNSEKLTPENKQKLEDVFREFPELKTAYDVKNELRDIFESDISRQNAQTQRDQ
ncbi:MAG: hypothetical protein B6244_06950 [Candidatus Cloacimonetes bacterium 4572_55]|nr:MAG: hypothetical protein B6244_06950 [Candidatus Cloacimonetes bacterium 4572_55]